MIIYVAWWILFVPKNQCVICGTDLLAKLNEGQNPQLQGRNANSPQYGHPVGNTQQQNQNQQGNAQTIMSHAANAGSTNNTGGTSEGNSQIYCPFCGVGLPTNAGFCPECGGDIKDRS